VLLDWWQRVTDSPRTRYLAQRRMGATEELALAVVASSYGLNTEVVRLGSDGTEKVVTIPWSLKDVERLLFTRHLYRSGRLHDD
jgi:hypothetical protein